MSATAVEVLPLVIRSPAALPAERRGADADWPHTTRLMPWLVAGFLAMVWLIPFDAITVSSISAPIDLKLDRIVLVLITLAWLLAFGLGGRMSPRFRSSPMNWAVAAFVAVAAAGVVANESTLVTQYELPLAIKKLSLLFSYVALFFMVTTVIRPSEVRNFLLLMLGLACITALGVIVEYHFRYDVFYVWSQKLFRSPFVVAPHAPDLPGGRPSITGPTQHGIAVATMLAMALPFSVVGMLRSQRRRRWIYAAAVALLLAGGLATQRKSGLVVPALALLTLTLYKAREMMRLLPAGLVLLGAILVLVPGAVRAEKAQLSPTNINSASTQSRTDDFSATGPDVAKYPVLGRGYGTFDPQKYRFLDNEYLHRLIETGFVGLASYIGMILAEIGVAHFVAKRLGPVRGSPGVAAVAAGAAYAVASGTFDALEYPQPVYLFLSIAGLMVCLSHHTRAASRAPAAGREA